MSVTTGMTEELEAADRVGAFGPCGAAVDSLFLGPREVTLEAGWMGRGQGRQRPLQPAPEPRPLCCRQASLSLVPRKDCGHQLAEGQGPRLTL